jgi:CHASE1-domain containing sensor protein
MAYEQGLTKEEIDAYRASMSGPPDWGGDDEYPGWRWLANVDALTRELDEARAKLDEAEERVEALSGEVLAHFENAERVVFVKMQACERKPYPNTTTDGDGS